MCLICFQVLNGKLVVNDLVRSKDFIAELAAYDMKPYICISACFLQTANFYYNLRIIAFMISCPVVECWQQRVLSCRITHTWDLALKLVAFLGSIGGWNWILFKWWDDGLFLKTLNKHARMWRLMCCMGCCRECQRGMFSWWVTTETRVLILMSCRQQCTAASTSYLCASRMVILWLCLLCLFRHVWPCICWWWHGPTSYGEYCWQVSGAVLATGTVREHSIWCGPTFEKRPPSIACKGDTCFLRQQVQQLQKFKWGQKTQSIGLSCAFPLPITSMEEWSENPLRSSLKLWESVQQQAPKKRGTF